MSDLTQIQILLEIQKSQARTQEAVEWIKEGMERSEERIDKHDTRLASIENRLANQTGSYSVISSIAGAIAGGVIAFAVKFFGTHT